MQIARSFAPPSNLYLQSPNISRQHQHQREPLKAVIQPAEALAAVLVDQAAPRVLLALGVVGLTCKSPQKHAGIESCPNIPQSILLIASKTGFHKIYKYQSPYPFAHLRSTVFCVSAKQRIVPTKPGSGLKANVLQVSR